MFKIIIGITIVIFELFSNTKLTYAQGTFNCHRNFQTPCFTGLVKCDPGYAPVFSDGKICSSYTDFFQCPVNDNPCQPISVPSNPPLLSSPGNPVVGGGAPAGSSIVDLNAIIDNLVGQSTGGKFRALTTLGGFMTKILPYLYAIAGFGLLAYLIFGGFMFMTSQGDPKKAEAAKTILTQAIMGFIIVFAAFWITQIINYIFGLGLTLN
ncbi:MAG: pilin [Patescibacteria group bacterium]|mgnify:CR=1 FL=1